MSRQRDPDLIRYSRARLESLVRGGVRALYEEAIDATRRLVYAERLKGEDVIAEDPADRIVEKVDIERAIAQVGLTDRERAFGALLAMGWSCAATARVLGAHPQQVWRLLNGEGERPGLASRLESFLNGHEEAP